MITWKGKQDLRVPMSPCEEVTEDPSLAAMDGCIFPDSHFFSTSGQTLVYGLDIWH